jgi:hypothetical protein
MGRRPQKRANRNPKNRGQKILRLFARNCMAWQAQEEKLPSGYELEELLAEAIYETDSGPGSYDRLQERLYQSSPYEPEVYNSAQYAHAEAVKILRELDRKPKW